MFEDLHDLNSPPHDIFRWRLLITLAQVPHPFAQGVLQPFEDNHVLVYGQDFCNMRMRAETLVGNAIDGKLLFAK